MRRRRGQSASRKSGLSRILHVAHRKEDKVNTVGELSVRRPALSTSRWARSQQTGLGPGAEGTQGQEESARETPCQANLTHHLLSLSRPGHSSGLAKQIGTTTMGSTHTWEEHKRHPPARPPPRRTHVSLAQTRKQLISSSAAFSSMSPTLLFPFFTNCWSA